MASMRIAYVDVGSKRFQIVEERLGDRVLGPVDYGVVLHYERYESFNADVFSPRNVVVGGCGPFAGSRLFGSHRMVFVFRSPETLGLHVSTMGGACYQFLRTGLHGFVVEGWSEEPVILHVKSLEGKVDVEFLELSWDRLWDVWRGYRGLRGTAALTAYAVEALEPKPLRVLTVGPAAARSIFGGIYSYVLDSSHKITPVVDSTSRAGGGSILLKAHGVAAIAFTGDAEPPEPIDAGRADEIARRLLGKPYPAAATSATVKYRFDPKLGTGGTFGVNYVHYRDLLPFLGYNTIYLSKAARLRILDQVLEHLWKPVQEEVFEAGEGKPWSTCGEPCPAACKKLWRGVKMDYEPSNALGPLIGVFRAEHVAELVKLADELGLDAIEAGHIVAWIFDLLHRGMLEPGEAGLDRRPFFDPLTVSVEQSSTNMELAAKLLEGLVEHKTWLLRLIAEEGLREAARRLEEKYEPKVRIYGLRYRDLLVYAAYGGRGYMTPNLYWAPGLIAPLPVPGRYWTVYSPTLPRDPGEFAELIRSRMVNEYLVDNAGICRFHRRWAEKMLEELYRELLGTKVNLEAHARRILGMIASYRLKAGAEPRPWESRKSIDLLVSLASELGDKELAEQLYTNPTSYWQKLHQKLWGWLLGGEPQAIEAKAAG